MNINESVYCSINPCNRYVHSLSFNVQCSSGDEFLAFYGVDYRLPWIYYEHDWIVAQFSKSFLFFNFKRGILISIVCNWNAIKVCAQNVHISMKLFGNYVQRWSMKFQWSNGIWWNLLPSIILINMIIPISENKTRNEIILLNTLCSIFCVGNLI